MANQERAKPLGQICEIDPQEVKFKSTVNLWVRGQATYDDVMKNYPSYLLPIPERIIRAFQNLVHIK